MDWKLAEAKNRLSEVVGRALTEGPQRITRRQDVVVLISEEEYDALRGKKRSFKEHLLNGPSFEGLEFERDRSGMRPVDL